MKKRILWLGLSFLLVTALVLTSCGEAVPGEQEEEEEEATPTTLPAGMGIIEIRVTDAPPKYTVTQIIVEISEDEEEGGVQVHRADGEGGVWETIDILGGQNPFILYPDLLGLEEVLAVGDVDAGKYTQIRMNLESVTVTYTYTEDGVPQGNTVEAIIPSSELKFVRPFYVEEGGETTITLDFDADKSVAVTGAPDKVIFKPVVKLSIEYEEGEEEEEELLGTIVGTVTDSSNDEPIEGATVVVEGTELSATTDGDYEIDDVPVGTYTVTASAAGYDDDSQSVTVIAGETSTADFALNPIPTTGTIVGTVTDSSNDEPIEGATVVVEGTELSATTDGDYEIDDVPVGTYTVTASAAGYDDDSQSVTVIAGETSTADFALEPSA